MYNWHVSFVKSAGGLKVKKVKANSKDEAIKKALKNEEYYSLKDCKLVR